MSTRIPKILLKTRDVLADPLEERWSKDRLIRLVDEAQKDISRHSKILKSETTLALAQGVSDYNLPNDVWLLNRAAFDSCVIPFLSHNNMDNKDFIASLSNSYNNRDNNRYYAYSDISISSYTCWEVLTAPRISAIIYDNRNMDSIRVFPIPDESINSVEYTFENAGPIIFDGDEYLGIVTDITDYTFDSIYGVVSTLYEPEVVENYLSLLGTITNLTETTASVTLWYTRESTEITSEDSELEIPKVFDAAIRYFVIGQAFLDDIDTSFRERGVEFMTLYDRELELILNTSNKDGVAAQPNRTSYRSAFE